MINMRVRMGEISDASRRVDRRGRAQRRASSHRSRRGASVAGENAALLDGAGVPPPRSPPPDRRWPGVVLIIVLGLFLAAAVIGPIVRSELPEELPQTHTHDEPPGASRRHGRSGTLHEE